MKSTSARQVCKQFTEAGIMADADLDSSCLLNKKIRNAQLAQYNFILGKDTYCPAVRKHCLTSDLRAFSVCSWQGCLQSIQKYISFVTAAIFKVYFIEHIIDFSLTIADWAIHLTKCSILMTMRVMVA